MKIRTPTYVELKNTGLLCQNGYLLIGKCAVNMTLAAFAVTIEWSVVKKEGARFARSGTPEKFMENGQGCILTMLMGRKQFGVFFASIATRALGTFLTIPSY
jgi:hypothetical protein